MLLKHLVRAYTCVLYPTSTLHYKDFITFIWVLTQGLLSLVLNFTSWYLKENEPNVGCRQVKIKP